MPPILLVCLGGGLGAVCRYLVTTQVGARFGTVFPFGTLTVNTVGSFLMGLIPLLALTAGVSAAAYGFFSSRFSSSSSLLYAMCHGLRSASPLIVLYVFAMQFLLSLLYALGIVG